MHATAARGPAARRAIRDVADVGHASAALVAGNRTWAGVPAKEPHCRLTRPAHRSDRVAPWRGADYLRWRLSEDCHRLSPSGQTPATAHVMSYGDSWVGLRFSGSAPSRLWRPTRRRPGLLAQFRKTKRGPWEPASHGPRWFELFIDASACGATGGPAGPRRKGRADTANSVLAPEW